MKKILIAFILVSLYSSFGLSNACTRVVYQGKGGTILTGRTMDWKYEMESEVWVFPRGMERTGRTGPNTMKWTSKYGSVTTSVYNMASADGMNEKGLVASFLWLEESVYPQWTAKNKSMSIANWLQFVLDNFATVDEMVDYMEQNPFDVISGEMSDDAGLAGLHLAVSDATGDNAILEYIGGELVIHHSKDYNVLTNSPAFDKQLAINRYWNRVDGTLFLPGSNNASDRFARASFYLGAVPKVEDSKTATTTILTILRSMSVPLGITTPDKPNISSTRWRTVSDQKNKIYYFDSIHSMNTIWLNFNNLDFSEKTPVKKIKFSSGRQTLVGEVSQSLVEATPFVIPGI